MVGIFFFFTVGCFHKIRAPSLARFWRVASLHQSGALSRFPASLGALGATLLLFGGSPANLLMAWKSLASLTKRAAEYPLCNRRWFGCSGRSCRLIEMSLLLIRFAGRSKYPGVSHDPFVSSSRPPRLPIARNCACGVCRSAE